MTSIPIGRLKVDADWQRDTLFADVDSVITPYVRGLSWRYGFSTQFELVAPPSEAIIVLDNSSGDWNIGQPTAKFTGKLLRGVLVRIIYDDGVTPTIMYIGRIKGIQVAPGRWGDRTATLTLTDWMDDLQETMFEPQLAGNVTTGFAIASQVFDSGIVPHPYGDKFWILGVGALNSTARLYQNTALTLTDQGQTVLGYVGDNVDQGRGINARSFLEEMCAAEMDGRLWYDARSGSYVFKDRHGWQQRYAPAGATNRLSSDIMTSAVYTVGEFIVNKITATVYPRSIGQAGQQLYLSETPIYVPPGGTRTITARYRDPNNPQGSCSAIATIPPVSGIDFSANSLEDGTGTDMTSSIVLSFAPGRSSAEVTIANGSTIPVYLTRLQIRGTPLYAHAQVDLTDINTESIGIYGQYPRALTIASVSNVSLVQEYLKVLLARYRKADIEWRSATFPVTGSGSDFERNVLFGPSPVGRVVNIEESWSVNATMPVSIIGEQHVVDIASNRWDCTWLLEPFSYNNMWVLNASALDVGTVAAF